MSDYHHYISGSFWTFAFYVNQNLIDPKTSLVFGYPLEINIYLKMYLTSQFIHSHCISKDNRD